MLSCSDFANYEAAPHLANSSDENNPLLSFQNQALQELEQKDQSSEYLESRAEAVEQIESTIQELGQMYHKLATIVSMHGEMAIRIDSDMDTALDNVNRGHSELLKMMESVSANRWLILKVFVTLILFAIFFIIFVA
jgi:syntaxin 5